VDLVAITELITVHHIYLGLLPDHSFILRTDPSLCMRENNIEESCKKKSLSYTKSIVHLDFASGASYRSVASLSDEVDRDKVDCTDDVDCNDVD
jgi:hypothetical protein